MYLKLRWAMRVVTYLHDNWILSLSLFAKMPSLPIILNTVTHTHTHNSIWFSLSRHTHPHTQTNKFYLDLSRHTYTHTHSPFVTTYIAPTPKQFLFHCSTKHTHTHTLIHPHDNNNNNNKVSPQQFLLSSITISVT